MIMTMIAGGDRLLAGRPMDLGGLDADLTDEFAGGDFGHCAVARFQKEKRPADLRAGGAAGHLAPRG